MRSRQAQIIPALQNKNFLSAALLFLLLLFVGCGIASANPRQSFGFDDPPFDQPRPEQLESISIWKRYPMPVISFKSSKRNVFYARILPKQLQHTGPLPADGDYVASATRRAGGKFIIEIKNPLENDTNKSYLLNFYAYDLATVLGKLAAWMAPLKKSETVELRISTLPVKSGEALIEQCRSGEFDDNVDDGYQEIYTLPFRHVRFGSQALPKITSSGDGKYTVSYPVAVRGDKHFAKDILPSNAYQSRGLLFDENELVRVHYYDGSLYDEETTYVCIPASMLPELNNEVTKHVLTGIGLSAVDVATLFLPTKWIGNFLAKTTNAALLGGAIGVSKVLPEVAFGGATVAVTQPARAAVVRQVVEKGATVLAPKALTTAAPPVAAQAAASNIAGQVLAKTAPVAAAEVTAQLGASPIAVDAAKATPVQAIAGKVLFAQNGLRIVKPHKVFSAGALTPAEATLVEQVDARLIELTQQAIATVERGAGTTQSAKAFYAELPSSPYYSARMGSAIHAEAFNLIENDAAIKGLSSSIATKKGIADPKALLTGHYGGLIPDIRMGLGGGREIVWDITTTKQLGKAIKYQQPFVAEIRELLY